MVSGLRTTSCDRQRCCLLQAAAAPQEHRPEQRRVDGGDGGQRDGRHHRLPSDARCRPDRHAAADESQQQRAAQHAAHAGQPAERERRPQGRRRHDDVTTRRRHRHEAGCRPVASRAVNLTDARCSRIHALEVIAVRNFPHFFHILHHKGVAGRLSVMRQFSAGMVGVLLCS